MEGGGGGGYASSPFLPPWSFMATASAVFLFTPFLCVSVSARVLCAVCRSKDPDDSTRPHPRNIRYSRGSAMIAINSNSWAYYWFLRVRGDRNFHAGLVVQYGQACRNVQLLCLGHPVVSNERTKTRGVSVWRGNS